MELRLAERRQSKIKLAIQGPAGSGKTYSSLLLAYGLCKNWKQIVIIDSENGSAHLYAHLGDYNVLEIKQPFNPEKYIEAISFVLNAGMAVIIIDGISQAWSGTGGILDIHSNMTGNSFTNWSKITPRHNAFINSILSARAHVIATLRSKQDYILQDKNGKLIPEKVGLKSIQRDDTDYEFTVVFNLDIRHNATATKDRTGLFENQTEFKVNAEVGNTILEWCNNVDYSLSKEQISLRIESCKSVAELLNLFQHIPQYQDILLTEFTRKRSELESNNINNQQNILTNGTSSSTGRV